MTRLSALLAASPLKLVALLAMVGMTVASALASGASFTTRTANPHNTFTGGILAHTNSKDGAAILTAAALKPGETRTGTVDIKNTGDIAGAFTLAMSNLSDTPASPAFSAKLDLEVADLGDPADPGAGTVKYTGKLGAMPSRALGSFAPGEAHRYRFKLTFPDGGAGADNAYMGASASAQFDWESQG